MVTALCLGADESLLNRHIVFQYPEERRCCSVGPGTALGHVNERNGTYKDSRAWQQSLV